MIQRIQSVYFLLAAILITLPFFLNIAGITGVNGISISFNAMEFNSTEVVIGDTFLVLPKILSLTISSIIAIILLILALFLYKNRPIQIRLTRITIVLLATIIAQNILIVEETIKYMGGLGCTRSYAIGFILPIIAIVFIVLAMKSIKKDEALVKSMNRIR